MNESWVVHHPYGDGTWRGLEKCSGQGFTAQWQHVSGATSNSAMLFFHTKEDADGFITAHGLEHAVAVRVEVVTPRIRGAVNR